MILNIHADISVGANRKSSTKTARNVYCFRQVTKAHVDERRDNEEHVIDKDKRLQPRPGPGKRKWNEAENQKQIEASCEDEAHRRYYTKLPRNLSRFNDVSNNCIASDSIEFSLCSQR